MLSLNLYMEYFSIFIIFVALIWTSHNVLLEFWISEPDVIFQLRPSIKGQFWKFWFETWLKLHEPITLLGIRPRYFRSQSSAFTMKSSLLFLLPTFFFHYPLQLLQYTEQGRQLLSFIQVSFIHCMPHTRDFKQRKKALGVKKKKKVHK